MAYHIFLNMWWIGLICSATACFGDQDQGPNVVAVSQTVLNSKGVCGEQIEVMCIGGAKPNTCKNNNKIKVKIVNVCPPTNLPRRVEYLPLQTCFFPDCWYKRWSYTSLILINDRGCTYICNLLHRSLFYSIWFLLTISINLYTPTVYLLSSSRFNSNSLAPRIIMNRYL